MEIETLPADVIMRDYFKRRDSTYKKVTYSYGYSPFLVELAQFVHTFTKYGAGALLYLAWMLSGLALMLAFVRPATCPPSESAKEIIDCGAPDSGYVRFLVWFVDWLAKAELIAPILLGMALLGALLIAWNMKKSRALRGEVDKSGPVAWPVALCAVAVLATTAFCWYYDLLLLGWDVRNRPVLTISVVLVAMLVLAASVMALRLRNSQFMRDAFLNVTG
jgi:hypothetical protein